MGLLKFFFTLHFLIIRRKIIKSNIIAKTEEVAKFKIRLLISVLLKQ